MSKALVYGDNINTDLVIAGKYTKTLNFEELAAHCMEDLDPQFSCRVKPGDVLVAETLAAVPPGNRLHWRSNMPE